MADTTAGHSALMQRAAWIAPLLPLIWMTDLTAILWLGLTAAALFFLPESRKPTFALVWHSIPASILLGAAVGVVWSLLLDPQVTALIERLTGATIDLSSLADVEGDTGNYIGLLLAGLLFGGIVEEIAFRGFFIGWGCVLFGRRAAIPILLITSAVFGYGHMWQGPAGAILIAVVGLMLGLVYLLSGRKLLPAIVTHMVSNFIGITQIYLYGT